MSNIRNVEDRIITDDSAGLKRQIWAETEIIAGYGYHPGKDRFTLSYLDETIWPEPLHNTVPISGVQTLLEMAFGARGPIIINSLYKRHGIGLPDETSTPSFLVPHNEDIEGGATSQDAIYAPGYLAQLFGLGITGTAENNITVHKVGYRETDIEMIVKTADGPMDAIMLPFRYTESELDPNERQKYFGKRIDPDTQKTAYFLKRFETEPQIKHIWRSSDLEGTKAIETIATNDTIWDQSRDDALKSLVELHFVVSEDDLKEWFNYKLDMPEACRFNTIGIFFGKYSENGKPSSEQFGDYCNVTLLSKLNIPTEHMVLSKDLEFIYRVYGS